MEDIHITERDTDGKPPAVNGLPPKHDRSAPMMTFQSPVRRRALPIMRDSMESLAADISADVSDITMEIEKISKGWDDPEQGMKDTSRLLKEIDTQMEISFEVMEERQTMVREFLKERERAEEKHQRRANQMMSQFNNKISEMEESLGANEIKTKKSKTSTTQTDQIATQNIKLQTSYDEIIPDSRNVQEVVKAFTQDMKDVIQKQLLKEKKLMLHQIETTNNQIDKKELDKTIAQLNKKLVQEKAQNLLTDLISAENDFYSKQTLSDMLNDLVDWLVKDGRDDDIIKGLNENLKEKLTTIRAAVYNEKLEFTPQVARTSEQCDTLELKSACRKIDLLEESLNLVLKEIQTNLELNDEELKYISATIAMVDRDARTHLVDEAIRKNGELENEKASSINKQVVHNLFEKVFEKKDQIMLAEDNFKNVLIQQLNSTDILKEQFTKLADKNRKLVLEKEVLLENFSLADETGLLTHPQTKFCIEALETTKERDINRDIKAIQPLLGPNLVHDLLSRTESQGGSNAVDLVRYQEKPLGDVIKDYEIEIEELYENFNESKAYREIDDLIIIQNSNDITSILKEEQTKTEEKLNANLPERQAVKDKLKILKSEKDELITTEYGLIEKKCFLETKLKNIDRKVATYLLQDERDKEKTEIHIQIAEVDQELQRVHHKIAGLEVKEPAKAKKLLSEKLVKLQDDLKKLTPYVNKNSTKYSSAELLEELPQTEQITELVDNRIELSRKLIKTENKIQDIITSDGYESSDSFELSDEGLYNICFANQTSMDKGTGDKSLNGKLFEIEMELNEVNKKMKESNLKLEDLNNLKETSEKLRWALNAVDDKLKRNPVGNVNKEIKELQKEISELKKKLKQKGTENFKYDENKIGNLLKSKIRYDAKIDEIIERFSGDETTGNVLRHSIKCLIQERDKTKGNIMSLNEDLIQLNKLKSNMNDTDSIHDKLYQVEQEMLQKKKNGISNMIYIAHDRLDNIIHKLKNEIKEKIEEKNPGDMKTKKNLTNEEKVQLSNELKEIVLDIEKTKEELECVEEYRITGDIKNYDNPLIESLCDKKDELLSNLDAINELVDKQISNTGESKLEHFFEDREEIKRELNDLDDRINEHGHILKERVTKLADIKQALEDKIADNISIEDFKTVISIFDEEEHLESNEQNNVINMYLNKRKNLHEDIIQTIEAKNTVKFQNYISDLEDTDSKIFARINNIMTTNQNIDMGTNLPYHLIADPECIRELMKAKHELESATTNMTDQSEVLSEGNLKEVFTELNKMEHLRTVLRSFEERRIDMKHYNDIKELKKLNEKKLQQLNKNIKQINLFIDKTTKLNPVDQQQTNKIREFEKITTDVETINRELSNTVKSYASEVQANENVLTSNQYVHEIPLKPTSLDFYLQDRDQKLNRLFLISKLAECRLIGESKILELKNEKEELERQIEEIDEKIINGDFDEDDEVGSQTRSFSPRSTSSRNSMTVVLDERDQLMEKIFQLQRKEDFLKESEDILNKQTAIEEIQERKSKLNKKLREIDFKLHQGDDLSDATLVDTTESRNTTLQNVNEEELKESLFTLREEVDSGEIKINSNIAIVTDIKQLLSHPKEIEVLEAMQNITDEINEETLKLKLNTLQTNVTKLEESMKFTEEQNISQNQGSVQVEQGELESIAEKIGLIEKKEELEHKLDTLKEKIEKDDHENKKIEDLTHKEFVKNEQVITKKELKRSKINLEQQLDELNVTINQYANSLEKEINKMEELQTHEDEIDEEGRLHALQSHKKELEDVMLKLQETKQIQASDLDLVELLNERRMIVNEIVEIKNKFENANIIQKKNILTKDLRQAYDEDKKYSTLTKEMENRIDILKTKTEKFDRINIFKKPKQHNDRLISLLGEELFNLLNHTDDTPAEKHLQDLMLCLEDRTMSEYVKEISTLCTIQTEQIENLKTDAKKFNDTQINTKYPDNHEDQIAQLENELISVYQKAEEAENIRKRLREKMGEELYQLITGAEQNQDQNNDKFLNNIKEFLNHEKGTIECLLRKNCVDSEKIALISHLTKDNDLLKERLTVREESLKINEDLIIQLTEDNKELQIELDDREDELHTFRRREDDFHSETESLRDNLQQCAQKTCSINEQAVRLKDDYEETKTQLDDVTNQNKHLNNIIQSSENNMLVQREELIKVKNDLQLANEEKGKAKSSMDDAQSELEIIRKKLKRISKEKTTLESNFNVQSSNLAKMEEEANSLKQKEILSKREMHKHCQNIEKKEKENKKMKDMTSSLEKQNNDLQNTINDLKEKYQAQSTKHQNETAKASKELRASKNKIEEHRNELEKLYNDIDTSKTEDMARMKRAYEFEKELHLKDIDDLNKQLDEQTQQYENDMKEITKKQSILQNELDDLTAENNTLLQKLHDLDESFENELSDTRKEMSDRYCKSIDQLNEKIRFLANDLIALEKVKNNVEYENASFTNENENLRRQIKEQEFITEEKVNTYQVKEKTKLAELEALRLENNELQDEMVEIRNQSKKMNHIERKERELKEGKETLKVAAEQLDSERSQFEDSVQFYLKKSANDEKSASKNMDDRVSIKLLKTSQEEREKISNELIGANCELLHTRNELRKLKSILRQKEEEFLREEKDMFSSYEQKQKQKNEELQKHHLKEKEAFLKMYNEERNKWEEEMKILKHDLQEDNLKKLSEQRLDYQKEIQQQIEKYLKQSKIETEELQDQVNVLNNQRTELIKQFESDKLTQKKKHESERYALEETIRRLLCNLMKFKAKRNILKHTHQDEISELEERFDFERERLEERREQELDILKSNIHKSIGIDIKNEKQILHNTFEGIINETNKYGPIRIKPEKESDAMEEGLSDKFTLNDLKELVHMGDLKDILDSEYQAEQEMIKNSMRDQYKVKLRIETDALMKRLLELSDELDSLRSLS